MPPLNKERKLLPQMQCLR